VPNTKNDFTVIVTEVIDDNIDEAVVNSRLTELENKNIISKNVKVGNRKMAMSGVRKNFSYLFGILTVAMYFIGLIIINRGLGFRNAMIIVSALIAYYIANVYNVATNKYKLKDMTTVIVINGILMTITTFSKILSGVMTPSVTPFGSYIIEPSA